MQSTCCSCTWSFSTSTNSRHQRDGGAARQGIGARRQACRARRRGDAQGHRAASCTSSNLSADEPDIVWVTEVWSDEAASDRALSGDLGEAGIGDVIALLAGPPELVDLTRLGGPGLS